MLLKKKEEEEETNQGPLLQVSIRHFLRPLPAQMFCDLHYFDPFHYTLGTMGICTLPSPLVAFRWR